MEHTPLQNAILLYRLSPDVREVVEGALALAAALAAFALRRRRWLINAGSLTLLALGLVIDVFSPWTAEMPRLMEWFQAAAVIFFFWGVTQLLLEMAITPRRRASYSKILHDLMLILLWAVVVAAVLYNTLHFDISKIFVSSAVILGAIGLGIQETLKNVFTGLTFDLAKPFKPGDWVRFQNHLGYVKGTTWSQTEIVTRVNERIQIPNSMLISQPVTNYASEAIADEIEIGISYDDSPGRVKETILKVVRDIPHVLSDPPPQVFAWDYGEYAIKYKVRYFLSHYGPQETVRDSIVSSLWYALRRHAIDIPYPTQNLQMRRRKVRREADDNFEREIIGDLRRVNWMRELSDEELRVIVPSVNVHQFGMGEVIVREGESGDSLYILRHGAVEVSAKSQGGEIRHVADITPASPNPFFGEGVITGEPRNATLRARTDVEVIEMSRHGFSELFEAHPELADAIAEVIASRGKERVGLLTDRQEADGARGRASRLLAKMREIFDLPQRPASGPGDRSSGPARKRNS